MNIVEKAKEWAHNAHDSINQKRKYNGESYWKHTDRVAEILKNAGESEIVQAAGHLHDILEDVNSSQFNEIEMEKIFGSKVVKIVKEVTNVFTKENYLNLNRSKRKHLEHERLAKISKESKSVKLADIIDNINGIVDQDINFGKVYIREKAENLLGLKDGNPVLFKMALEVIKKELSKLDNA